MTDLRKAFDAMAKAVPVLSASVRIDDTLSYTFVAIRPHSMTFRHLFSSGSVGNRSQSNLIARTDGFTRSDNDATVDPATLEDALPGQEVTVAGQTLRIVAASATPDGGLIRLTLDALDTVGQ